jgi:Flp pilus assembly protein TadD
VLREVDRSQALSSHAVALMSAGRLPEARALQRRALELSPENPFLLVNAGDAALRAGDLPAAHQACTRAIAVRPTLAPAHTCQGIALARQGRVDAAEAAFRRALALDQEGPESRFNLAVLLAQTGRPAPALRLLSENAAAHPTHTPTRHTLDLLRRPR